MSKMKKSKGLSIFINVVISLLIAVLIFITIKVI